MLEVGVVECGGITMICKQCEEKNVGVPYGREEHGDNIHDCAENLEFAYLRLSREVLHYIR